MTNLKIQTDENQVIDWDASKASGDTIIFMDIPHEYKVGDWVEHLNSCRGTRRQIKEISEREVKYYPPYGFDYIIDIKPCAPSKPAQSYEEIKDKSGWIIDHQGNILQNNPRNCRATLPHYKTEQQALSAQAFADLTHLYADWIGDYVPDWGNDLEAKYCISNEAGKVSIDLWYSQPFFLDFPTKDLAEQFLECHRELIEVWMMIDKGGE